MRVSDRKQGEAGFTVLEAAVSMAVLAVALLSLWGTIVYCSRSNVAAEQRKKALNAAQAKIEELKSQDFATLIAQFGPAGSVGDEFMVSTLDEYEGGAGGKIFFYLDETKTTFGENGGPIDLNGDGDTTDTDVSAGFQLLPARVSVRWVGPLGPQRVDLHAILRKED